MKKLLSLLFITVAAMLPQSVWADNEASLDTSTHTLTIYSSTAGNLAGGNVSHFSDLTDEDKASVTKIKLIGYFNESDLIALKGRVDADEQSSNNGKFMAVTEVDMADARFESATSAPSAANYKLYHTVTPASGTEGERIIVGGTLFQSAPGLRWANVSAPSEGTTFITSFDHSSTSTSGHSVGEYGKDTPVTKYVQMNVAGESWSGPNNKGYNNFNEPSSATEITLTGSEAGSNFNEKEANKLATVLQDYYGGQYVYFNRYFKTQLKSGSTTEYEWIEGTQSDWNNATGEKYNNPNNVDFNNMSSWYASQGEHPESNVMLVKVYYQKQETSRYWTDYSGTPSSYIDLGTSDYAYRDNHKNSYWSGAFKNGDIVMLTDYTYWQLQNDGTWGWVDASYADGDEHYINVKYANFTDKQNDQSRPTGANQYAVVMGTQVNETFTAATEKIRNDNDWKDPNAVTSSQYADMKFSYWSYTLQNATTSKYADDEINTDIFRDCKALTTVDFKAGVLKGFENHNKVNGYTASLSVTVGKDVTRIASSAFKDCDALTTITFDKDYSASPYNTKTYPKVLTIDENAFLNSTNLTGITIPNRVSSIGSSAFHNAGNNVDEFSVTFERRYYSDKTEAEGDYTKGKDFDVPLTISSGAFENCKKLKTLSLPVRLTSLGSRAFANTESLQTLTMRENTSHALQDMTNNDTSYDGLLTIPSGAFTGSHVEEVTIPKSVTLIESGAFQQTNYLSKLTIQADNTDNQPALVIKEGAFAGGDEKIQPVLDVYVNIDPAKRKIICEYNAFTFTQLVGQTNEGSKQFGKLHFDEAYWDYYQGNWKKGLAFQQNTLNAFKDGYTDTSKGYDGKSEGAITTEGDNAGKYVHAESGKQYTPANGWQQFASTSTAIDIDIPRGSFMRAFSTNTAYIIPTFATNDGYNKQGDPMFDIYRIVKFSDDYSDGKAAGSTEDAQAASRVATAKQVVLTDDSSTPLRYIPSETGLLMVGHISSSYLVYFDNAYFSDESHETKYPYEYRNIELDKDAAENNTNLLYPACIENHRGDGQGGYLEQLKGEPDITSTPGMIYLNSTIPCPYTDSNLKFRLFGYSPKKNQFIRTGGVNIARDKAYLKLTPAMFHWSNEYNGGDASGSSSGIDDPSGARVSQVFLEFFDDDEESGTTGIKQVDTNAQRVESNVFYTLEGVKLNSRPTQRGIYIHNGRKVVIK